MPEAIAPIRHSPLEPLHRAAGAQFTDFGGWWMPLRYASDIAEHRAVRRAAGLFDISHMGEIVVTGPQAPQFLDYALTGSFADQPAGRARYTLLVDAAAHVLDDLIVSRLAPDAYLIVANAANAPRDFHTLAARTAHFHVAVTDATDSLGLLALQGPRALDILRPLTRFTGIAGFEDAVGRAVPTWTSSGAPVPTTVAQDLEHLRYYRIGSGSVCDADALISRTGYTGEDGFEILVPAADAARVWQGLVAAGGERLTLCGLAARDSLRLEAAMPLYGHELTERTTPWDAGLGRAVHLEKPDQVGREALAAAERAAQSPDHPTLHGLELAGRRAARAGYAVVGADGAPLGRVTSGLLSPTLGHPIALAYLPRALRVGEGVRVDVRGRTEPARVAQTPFYRRERAGAPHPIRKAQP